MLSPPSSKVHELPLTLIYLDRSGSNVASISSVNPSIMTALPIYIALTNIDSHLVADIGIIIRFSPYLPLIQFYPWS